MVLVFAESPNGQFKKAALEAVTYASTCAKLMNTSCIALVIGDVVNAGDLGQYGADKVLQVASPQTLDSQSIAHIIAQVAQQNDANLVLVSHTSTGKSILGRLAIKLKAASVSGVNELPTIDGEFKVKKAVFSGKAFAEYTLSSPIKVLSLMGNAISPIPNGATVPVENILIEVPQSRVKVLSVQRQASEKAPLPEAEIVVSAGRGLKGPENWGIVEDLADALGATTACSRPVADMDWRPHHEHVGQTGIAIRPNLYIACGISGAIQHLAGVNSSKVIVVINKDPEAPFFKAADYGVVGDVFEVLPKLTEAVKNVKR